MPNAIAFAVLVVVAPAQASSEAVPEWQRLSRQAATLADADKYDQALPLAQQALASARKALKPGDPRLAQPLATLGSVDMNLARYPQADSELAQALALLGHENAKWDGRRADVLHDVCLLRNAQGRNADAIKACEQALALRETAFGPDSDETAASLDLLGTMHSNAQQFAAGEPLLRRALAIRERLDPEGTGAAAVHSNLGALLKEAGRIEEAEPEMLKALAIFQAKEGAEGSDMPDALGSLGGLLAMKGDYAQAEKLKLQAVALSEKLHGRDHDAVAQQLSGLADLYRSQGRNPEAEQLERRALAIREKLFGADSPMVATSLNGLASALSNQGKNEESEKLYLRGIRITEASGDPNGAMMATQLNDLGVLYLNMVKPDQAEPYIKRALAIEEATLGPDHFDTVNVRNSLAGLYFNQAKYDLAEPLFRQNIAAEEKIFGTEHPGLSNDLDNLANNFFRQNRPEEAAVPSRRSTAILRQRFDSAGAASSDALVAEQKASRPSFALLTTILAQQMKKTGPTPAIAAESFELAQLAEASLVGANIAQMAARFAGKDDELARLVREQQDLGRKLATAEATRVSALSAASAQGDAESEAQLQKDIDTERAELARRDGEIAARFPAYQALTSQKPVSATEAQALLAPNEAMVVYMLVKRQAFAWVVRHDRVDFIELPTNRPDVITQVQFIRSKLQPDDAGKLPEIAPATSNTLYKAIFAPLEPSLAGASKIILVPPQGALQGIPFGVLGDGEGAGGHWLAKRYAFEVLPSVSSLRALREFQRGKPASAAFVGFGDPALDGPAEQQRGLSTAQVYTTRGVAGLADVDSLRKAPRLPETADELRSLSSALGGKAKDVYLGERATETVVKSTDLSKFRLVAFATHGVTAGELAGANEPGLVLTPPSTPSAIDDGYLSSGEVADLKLNADWVLLSACNTAAADGAPGAEGLSGLARAFFYSGSRALLVSNWPVASEATRQLVSTTVRNYAHAPKAGKAEALRLAMVSMMDDPQFAHPFYWAPFSVVGD